MPDSYELFVARLYQKKGLDLSGYKRPQMERRIGSLMRSFRVEDFLEFMNLLEKDPQIYHKFLETLTINVTEFYRNPPQWETLKKEVLPFLFQNSMSLKVWSAGCATGEEPYTLAMLLTENYPDRRWTVLASDLDQDVLAKSSAGIYGPKAVANLPPEWLKKYFTQDGENYIVSPAIKSKVRFMHQNLLKDTFDINFDLILCRNVVIYFTEQTKSDLYKKFAGALKPKGVLFTGSTEQIFQAHEIGFELMTSFFYRKKEAV